MNFELSGLLAEEQNTYLGIVLKFTEPPEAQKPTERWRLYVFREGKQLGDPLMLHEESCYLFGMNSAIADVRLDHPSCDEQHAVLQYRSVEREDEDRMPVQVVIPYLMDLESKAGTYINGDRIEPRRYYEILEKDLVHFGHGIQEYVFLQDRETK